MTICPTCVGENHERARFCLAYGRPIAQGNEKIGEGRCLIALGRTAEAGERLADAREALARFRALPLLSSVDDLLGEATAWSG